MTDLQDKTKKEQTDEEILERRKKDLGELAKYMRPWDNLPLLEHEKEERLSEFLGMICNIADLQLEKIGGYLNTAIAVTLNDLSIGLNERLSDDINLNEDIEENVETLRVSALCFMEDVYENIIEYAADQMKEKMKLLLKSREENPEIHERF